MKQKLLFLLVLLLTATTGAWAQSAFTAKEITSASQLTSTDDEAYVAACMPSDFLAVDEVVAKAWTGAPTDGSAILIYAIDGDKIKMATFLNGDNKATTGATWSIASFKNQLTNGQFFYTAATTYSVTLAEGTEDADKWTVKVGEGQAQALPIGGLKGDGSETVTLQYNGRLKVKGVKATSDAAPAGKTVDLSTYSGDSYEVTEDVTFTGTTNNEISILYKGDGYEVTLDNVNAPKCFIAAQDDYYNINVKLKGTSRLRGIYTQNAYIIIGEAEAGGTVILVDENIPLGSPGTTITINGGTVKAKSSYSALDSSLEVNGGAVYLEAGEDKPAVAGGGASGSVTLYGWNGSAWVTYTNQRYLSTDNSKAPSEWTW